VNRDPRSEKVAIVADALFASHLPDLSKEGYGVMQLPPLGLDPRVAAEWLQQTAEQVAEYARNGYELVLVDDGSWGARLDEALARLGTPPLVRR
jgi:hypothetical protein